jgi:hypothetical protein
MRTVSQKIHHEKGAIVIIALVLLILVTLMGMTITQITSIEMQVAANERDHKRVFYLAEAAMMEALQRLENALPDELKPNTSDTLPWIHVPYDPNDSSTHDLEDKDAMADAAVSAASTVDPNAARYATSAEGVAPGSSLAMTTTSQLYSFDAYGYAEDRAKALILGGFRRRF